MKIEIHKDWCLQMVRHEGDAEIGAGRMAFDPVFDGERASGDAGEEVGPNVAFGRLVNLMRRRRGVSLEQLAHDADVDTAELLEIESDPYHRTELPTAYRLANYFKVPQAGLMQVAGLAVPKKARLLEEGVRLAAGSESAAELSSEEGAALEALVAVLGEQTSE